MLKPNHKVHDLGEFVVNGNTIRTARRLAEYLQNQDSKKFGRPPQSVFHVIQPTYCKMLGINPDDMIAISLSNVWKEKFETDIAINFRQLPEKMPLTERIFEAHSKAYGVGMDKTMKFVKERYFEHKS